MKNLDLEFGTPKDSAAVDRAVLGTWTSQLAASGYELTYQSDVGAITYSRKYRRWYIILLAVLLFPIGLRFLLAADTATITAIIEPDDDGGSALIINGKAPKNVRQGLEALEV